jgi:hypothetical protein
MRANSNLFRSISASLVLVLTVQLAGCGTVFYPTRKGQVSGEIDPVVAIADAIGLLFFLVPGVIAFAVDFTNGTIYLPQGKRARLTSQELESITRDQKVDIGLLNELLNKKISYAINLSTSDVYIKRFDTAEALFVYWSKHSRVLASL